MTLYYTNNSLVNIDLNVTCCGTEACEKGHSFGPAIRDYYLIHYVLKGKGKFEVGGKTYYLEQGMGFLIEPEILTYYKANNEEPWEYVWIGFRGSKAKQYMNNINITTENPIFKINDRGALEKIVDEMLSCLELNIGRELLLQSCLYRVIYILTKEFSLNECIEEKVGAEKYVEEGVNFIVNNYSRNININDVTKFLNINRTYLHRLFKKYVNMSPQQFLMNYRIDRSCELLKNNSLSIGDVARSVGYYDVLLFSKTFKKYVGKSPSRYREENILIKGEI